MGKSNRLNIIKETINKEQKIHDILNIDEIKKLEKINKEFIEKVTIHFSDFVKKNVKLNFFTIKINSYANNEKNMKYLFSNRTEILNLNKKLFVFFSDNLLSIFVDLLFGGNGTYAEKINQKRNLTYIEDTIAKKILKIIFSAYQKFFEKNFSIDVDAFSIKIINTEKDIFLKNNYITNYFNLSLNGIGIFFSILLPISVIKKHFQKVNSLQNKKNFLIKNIDFEKNIPIVNLYDIKLNVIIRLIMFSKKKYNSLSIGDILVIKNPEKVVAYIEKIPVFLGCYKNCDKKSVVFLNKFIHKM